MIKGKVTKVLGNGEYEFEYDGKRYIQNLQIAVDNYKEYQIGDEFEMDNLSLEASDIVE